MPVVSYHTNLHMLGCNDSCRHQNIQCVYVQFYISLHADWIAQVRKKQTSSWQEQSYEQIIRNDKQIKQYS